MSYSHLSSKHVSVGPKSTDMYGEKNGALLAYFIVVFAGGGKRERGIMRGTKRSWWTLRSSGGREH